MKHLRVVLILIVLLLGIAGAAIFTANAGAPVGGDPLAPRIYLPLVARSETTPTPGAWITVMEEGFKDRDRPQWKFFDYNGTTSGEYYWADRTCHALTGQRSAWAVGGGAGGVASSCNSDYPDNADSWMKYGPFNLADAKMAQFHFHYYQNGLGTGDEFCWYASDDNVHFAGLCLSANPGGRRWSSTSEILVTSLPA